MNTNLKGKSLAKSELENTFHQSKEFIEEAIEYENKQFTPYEALCLKKSSNLLSMLYIFMLLATLLCVSVGIILFFTTNSILSVAFLGISVVGFYSALELLNRKSSKNNENESYDRFLLQAAKGYKDFLKIFENHPNLPILGLNYFKYNSPLSYKLFNFVTTFAFDSFTLADTQDNEEALVEILSPMVTDLIQEAIDNFETALDIEIIAAHNEAKQLQKQVELDIHAYSHRMFKKTK